MKFLSQELPSHSNRRARFNQTQLRGCFVDAIGLETTCAICIAPRWHSVVNLGDVDGRIERPMVSDQARDMSGVDATTSVWPYDGPTPTHSLGPCFPVLPLRQNCARKNKPWGTPLEQGYCCDSDRSYVVNTKGTLVNIVSIFGVDCIVSI